ncbi:hypothetical protein JHK82_034702 [Glycine max]|nr:hypothetical protein JHK86_034773 [Glycine max]KAG5120282.1 hypothetical protein JHK82_034702 [Glycine max]
MTSSRERLVKAVKQFVEVRYKVFSNRYGQNIIDILDFPIKVVLSPFTLAFDIAGSAPRGFGVPELISKLSATSVFVSPFSPFLLFFFSLTFRSISLLFFCYSISLSNFWVFEEMEIKGHFLDAASFAYLDSENVFVFVIKMSFFFFTIPPSIAVKLFMLSALEFEYWAIAALGTYDIAFELGRKVICQRNCNSCNGWRALRCTMCRGSGRVHYQVKNCNLKSGEKATAESVADAIANNRAELVHIPSSLDFQKPLPSKECPTCDGTGVMSCHECKHRLLHVRISADDVSIVDSMIMEPPWQAYNVLKKIDYPYEHILHSMKDPSIAAFWLITFPQIMGGFTYDDDVKQKIWWQYKENMRYDQLRDVVAKRKPGWEYLQDALISIDPARARDDPVIVKNVPYYKAKKALETEVMKIDPPPRPPNWGVRIHYLHVMFAKNWQELDLPLNASSWSEEDLQDPDKFYEMTVLLNAQREISDKILDAQWETKWRQDKLNEMLEAKVKPYIQDIDNAVLPEPILLKPQNQEKRQRRRWFFF